METPAQNTNYQPISPPPPVVPLPNQPFTSAKIPDTGPQSVQKKANFLPKAFLIIIPLFILIIIALSYYLFKTKKLPIVNMLEGETSHPASLSFEPASGAYNIGQTFTTSVIIDTGGEQTNGADVLVIYDQDKLEFISAEINDLYSDILTPNPAPNPDIPGHLTLGAASSSETYNGKAVFAIITFKPIAEGTTNLSFSFNPEKIGSTLESNISYHGKDLLGSITGASYAIEIPQNNIQCTSLYPQPDNPQRGDTLTFTCTSTAADTSVNHYNFRINEGAPVKIDSATTQAAYNFTVPDTGTEFYVQCQVCASVDDSDCTAWGQTN